MRRINVRQAREKLSELLDEAERGESVIIERRGRPVARLVPAGRRTTAKFPDLSEFRAGIRIKGKPMSRTVIEAREQERY